MRYSALKKIHGDGNTSTIQSARILVVGAGGIGCEILKNLAMLGVKYIELIDLDTIDVSNLNRQFLFRSQHVGQSKALVAAEAAKRFNPDIQVIPHHANIKDKCYGISFFKGFDVVLNALDNVDARRHVNRLCLAAAVPLIDSGTTGFEGQVMPIIKGVTACYECKPKPTQKVYPVCTIRSTPDKPVHCIVWAKELFKLLLGSTKDSMLYEDTAASGDTSTYMHLVDNWYSKSTSLNGYISHIREIIVALFKTEIEKRIAMDTYKTAAKTPLPVEIQVIDQAVHDAQTKLHLIDSGFKTLPSSAFDTSTVSSCFAELIAIVYEASRPASNEETLVGKLVFDKDDELAMRFVCAASNIRSSIFSIPTMNYHDAKGIAGNIIPAISTTNAIVASIQVLEAVKIITNKDISLSELSLKHVYCKREPSSKKYLMPTDPDTPETACFVCNTNQLQLEVDTSMFTLKDFVVKILKGKLGFVQPVISIGRNCIYEEFDENDEDFDEDSQKNLLKVFDKCPGGGLVHDSIAFVSDSSLELKVEIVVKHVSKTALEELGGLVAENMFNIIGGNMGVETVARMAAEANQSASSTSTAAATSDEPSTTIVEDDFEIVESSSDEPASKKLRAT